MDEESKISSTELFESTETNVLSSTLSSTENKKQRKTRVEYKHITTEQRECMMNYVIDNPEIITHSSTKENERELWNDLVAKLNNLKPEKTINRWKNFWQRWQTSLALKPDASLTVLDYKLKQFINKIMKNDDVSNDKVSLKSIHVPKRRLTLQVIYDRLKEVEKEKCKLNLEVDENDFKILKYKHTIKSLENQNIEKRKRIKYLYEKKYALNKRRRTFEEEKEITEELQGYQKIKDEDKVPEEQIKN